MKEAEQPDRALQFGNTAIRVFLHPLSGEERRQRDEQAGRIARRILLGWKIKEKNARFDPEQPPD